MKRNHTLSGWLFDKVIKEKFNNWFGFLLLLTIGLGLTYFAASAGKDVSIAVLMGVIALPFVVLTIMNVKLGFYLLVLITSFMPLIERAFYLQIKAGTYIDIFIYFLAMVCIIKKFLYDNNWKFMKHPITLALLAILAYDGFQILNPNGNATAWFYGFRLSLRFVLLYLIAESVFKSKKDLFTFLKVWLTIALLAALYAIYQEWVGLPSFDFHWVNKSPERRALLWLGNRFRKWSFLSDVANFGLFMSFAGMIAVFTALGKVSWYKRIILIGLGLTFWVAMVYSGTRTAYGIIPIGIAVYVFMNIDKVRNLVFAVMACMIFVFLLFAPIYNPSLNRLRSAFNPDEDASMNVRDINRSRIQPYILSHPIGGGLLTSGTPGEEYYPSHPLAGFPPDSGFLKTLLETGWIGLFLQMALFVIVLGTGVINYHSLQDPVLKGYLMAFIAGFFALTIALYSKLDISGFPLALIIYSNYIFIYKLKEFDKEYVPPTEDDDI